MDNYVINENGEKVIVGSRRPDGTVRKERRVRAGYTPQDEQPAYVSAGAAVSQAGNRCTVLHVTTSALTAAARRPAQSCGVPAAAGDGQRAATSAHPAPGKPHA